jgi:hypothetical protein
LSEPERQPHPERELRDLTAVADGSLNGERAAALSASPETAALLERQRVAVGALRDVDVRAPLGLRERIEAERTRAARPARRRRVGLGALAAGGVAALALAVALTLPSGGGGPSVVEAAELAERPAAAAAPGVERGEPALLAADGDGVPFPNWTEKFEWRASGAREDDLDGRDATTVFYSKDGKRIGYTILSGDLIEPPDGARRATREGTVLHHFRDGDRTVVTWEREGRTCVLSGAGVELDVLLDLAAWQGKGAVAF